MSGRPPNGLRLTIFVELRRQCSARHQRHIIQTHASITASQPPASRPESPERLWSCDVTLERVLISARLHISPSVHLPSRSQGFSYHCSLVFFISHLRSRFRGPGHFFHCFNGLLLPLLLNFKACSTTFVLQDPTQSPVRCYR